jgi:hypothetical protein
VGRRPRTLRAPAGPWQSRSRPAQAHARLEAGTGTLARDAAR